MPPKRRPFSPERSRKPKCRRAWAETSTRIVPPPRVLGEILERFALRGAGRLVDQRPQPRDLLLHPVPAQKVQPRRQDRRLDDRVAGAVEADELAGALLEHDAPPEPAPLFAQVLRCDDELLPGTGVLQHLAPDLPGVAVRRHARLHGAAREQENVVGEVDDPLPDLFQVLPGHGAPERPQQHPPLLERDPHRREIDPPLRVDRRDDRLQDHRPRSIMTSTRPTRGRTNLRTRTTARLTGNFASTRSRTLSAAASTRWKVPPSR